MKTLLEKIEKKFGYDSKVYDEVEDLQLLLEAAQRVNDDYLKVFYDLHRKINYYKAICRAADVPELIIKNPELFGAVEYNQKDIEQAKLNIQKLTKK